MNDKSKFQLTSSINCHAVLVLLAVNRALLLISVAQSAVIARAVKTRMPVHREIDRVASFACAALARTSGARLKIRRAASFDVLANSIVSKESRVALIRFASSSLGCDGIRHALRVILGAARHAMEFLSDRSFDVALIEAALQAVGTVAGAIRCALNRRWTSALNNRIGGVEDGHTAFVRRPTFAKFADGVQSSAIVVQTFDASQSILSWVNDSITVVVAALQARRVSNAAFVGIWNFVCTATERFAVRIDANETFWHAIDHVGQYRWGAFKSLALVTFAAASLAFGVAQTSFALCAIKVRRVVANLSGFGRHISVAVTEDDFAVFPEECEASLISNELIANLINCSAVARTELAAFAWDSVCGEQFVVAVLAGTWNAVGRDASGALKQIV